MNNQELNSRTMEKSTRSCGRRNEPYGYAFKALSKIWLALAVGFLLIPGVARAQQYVFENIAFPGDTFTQLLGINDADVIAGYHGIGSQTNPNQGFTLILGAPNNFTSENFPNSAQTQVTGINSARNTSGFYIDGVGTNHGFLNINGTFSTVDFPGTTFNQVLGLNNTGQAAGYFQDPSGAQTPFLFNPFLPPGGQFTIGGMANLPVSGQATDINDQGLVTGFFPTATGENGFLLNGGIRTTLTFPGASVTEALGLNNSGQVVGFYQQDANSAPHGFIYSGGVFTALNDPGATATTVNGINNLGQIVGFALEPGGNTVGFVGAPLVVPEPSLLSLLALGSTALVGMCILRSRRSSFR